MRKKKLAILSPNHNQYSESFIQAHKTLTNDLLYYYGGNVPQYLEGYGMIYKDWYKVRYLIHILFILFHPRLLFYPNGLTIEQKLLGESLRSNKVTHVLAEFGTCAVEVMDICEYLGIKLISHFHGFEISTKEILVINEERYRRLFDISYKVVAVSHLMENNLMKLGCPKDKLIYCPCGPNDSFLKRQPSFNNNNILFIGRFVDKKAPYDLVLAFSKVVKEIPNAHLIMIGKGELYDCCVRLASYLGLVDSINFEGVVEHDIIERYFENASVYCQPSATAESGDQEGTPVSVMEASLSGLPVVSTRHAGIPDVIIDGDTGLLVDEHDVDGLASALIRILKDKSFARNIGKKGRKFIKKKFILSISLNILRSNLD